MKRIKIVVEGATEERFVKDVLASNFYEAEIYLIPSPLNGLAKRYSYKKLKKELKNHLYDESAIVTTMIDYYGLPEEFPGFSDKPAGNCYEKINFLENEFGKDVNRPNFLPYLQLHEFEALLFSSMDGFKETLFLTDEQFKKLQSIVFSIPPEEINDGKQTHPSQRIESIYPEYGKVSDGILIAQTLGLKIMRDRCPHFNEWITKLENIKC